MKKILLISITVFFVFYICASAGSIPEDLLHEDKALVFFGELISLNEESYVEVKPVKKIKGEVELGEKKIFFEPFFGFKHGSSTAPKIGTIYLFAYFDENNPIYIFKASTMDTKTLQLEGIGSAQMWNRLEEYLNEGRFEEAEKERQNKKSSDFKEQSESIKTDERDKKTFDIHISIITIIVSLVVFALVFRKRK